MSNQPHFYISRRSLLRSMGPAFGGLAVGSAFLQDLQLVNSVLAAGPYDDYKALVCIFLNGGSDMNNLIIPTLGDEYQNYATIRTPVLAIPNADGSGATAQALSPLNSDGHAYGLHPACFELAKMFNQSPGYNDLGGVAAVLNVGPLVYPMTKAQYVANSIQKPPQLFSHSDQVTQWQTSISDQPPSTGWGGRMADLLHSFNPQNGALDRLSTCITIAGTNTFQVGDSVQQYSVGTGGVVSLANPNNPTSAAAGRRTAMNSILALNKAHANPYTSSYARALDGALATGAALSTALQGSQMASYWSTVANWSKTGTAHQIVTPNGGSTFTSGLMQQLKMVAQIIEAGARAEGVSNGLGMKRQIFFVNVGGYDTHTNQTNNAGQTTTNDAAVVLGSHANLLAELSQSIWAFQKAIKQIGVVQGKANFVNQVTSFTASDFGRTFPSNGLGSDHGWGSHHLVIGGAVQGRKTFGQFPTLAVGGPDDTSTGRWIPTTSVDQYAGSMARWLGLNASELTAVFPNLTRFPGSYNGGYLGFMG